MFKLKELLKIQREFADSLAHKPTLSQYVFAMNIEISELLNTLPWKWWKRDQTINKERTLDELADVLAFWFSACNLVFASMPKALVEKGFSINKEIELIQFQITTSIEEELKRSKQPISEFESITYETANTFTPLATAGRRLGRLIGKVMVHTGATYFEVVEAYKNKMVINWERQQKKY